MVKQKKKLLSLIRYENICYYCTYIVLIIYRANSFHIHLSGCMQGDEADERMNIKIVLLKVCYKLSIISSS